MGNPTDLAELSSYGNICHVWRELAISETIRLDMESAVNINVRMNNIRI